jgi:hypothetical protein
LLLKLKAKDQRIRELTKQLHTSNEETVTRLQLENDQLNVQHA